MITIFITNISNLKDPLDVPNTLINLPNYRIDKIKKQKDLLSRKQSLGAGYLINHILKLHNINPCDIRINEFGKPYVDGLYFNVSHSYEYVICAVGNVNLGCDIEQNRSCNIKLADRFFNPKEIEYLNKSNNKNLDFIRIWTAKESYVKMIGKGLNIPLKSFYYDINDNKIEHYYISHHYYNNYTISVCSEINMPINIKYLKI